MSGDPSRQRRFYESRPHGHLQPRVEDFYAAKLAATLAAGIDLGAQDRVLEVGAGFGRFTFEVLRHCGSVVALDLSPRALATLDETRTARGIDPARCETRCGDLTQTEDIACDERFRFIVGFFILHHVPDVAVAIRGLQRRLAPGGTLAFVEPNRRNPLFLAQVACCADMTWAEEQGMFRLSARGVESAFRAAGLTPLPLQRFGFFPPQLLNCSETIRRLETRLERVGLFEPVLPFLLLRARATAAG
jgi:SAM-dependent methyltransferase